mmetsp:Transcript_29244/g.95303  ORF Transcript_29244/g.95303 Transcript_29244/m.95303 type:complete len:195 (-) Transcript_29244:90-674(-)
MDFFSTANDFKSLESILALEEEDKSFEAEASGITPATLGAPGRDDGVAIPRVKQAPADPKAIWTDEELENAIDTEEDDGLERPNFEFLYKQDVTPSDNYLGMAYVHKDPSSACCEALVLKVELPGTDSLEDLDLDVQAQSVRLRSPLYKLLLQLPETVDSKRGKAKWDSKKQELSVTLPIVRELGWVPNPLDPV